MKRWMHWALLSAVLGVSALAYAYPQTASTCDCRECERDDRDRGNG